MEEEGVSAQEVILLPLSKQRFADVPESVFCKPETSTRTMNRTLGMAVELY